MSEKEIPLGEQMTFCSVPLQTSTLTSFGPLDLSVCLEASYVYNTSVSLCFFFLLFSLSLFSVAAVDIFRVVIAI